MRLGPERYRWMKRLGNAAILSHVRRGKLIDPRAAAELLDLSLEMHGKRRRVIYFCSCPSPTDGCHRHWVAPHLLRVARARRQPVTVVEWPGFDSEPATRPAVKTMESVVNGINAGRVSLPLGHELPAPRLLGLPWFTLVDLVDASSGKRLDFMLSGPAEHRAGRWQLPVMGGKASMKDTLKLQREEREASLVLPRSWPALRNRAVRLRRTRRQR